MHPNFYLSPLAACIALTMASSAKAAEPISLHKSSLENLKQHFQLQIPGLKQAAPVNQANTLQVVKQHTDNKKITHIRMQQQYKGFVVVGGYAITHSSGNAQSLASTNAPVKMNGVVYSGLDKELGAPAADFVKNGKQALEQFSEQFKGKSLSKEQVTPIVYIDEKNEAHWAYKVSVTITPLDNIPERPTAILDAKTGKAYVQWNDIKTESKPTKVFGMGYGGNSKTGEFFYGKTLPALELTRIAQGTRCLMETDDVKVVDMKHRYSSDNEAMSFICKYKRGNPKGTYWTGYKGDGYDKDNGAFSPTNDAMYAGYVIKHMYRDWYDEDALTHEDGSPMQLVMRVHYGQGYENAYWDGEKMTFGDGEDMMYPLVSLGVGAHEISHGFTEQHANLEYYAQSGGMNESFSDMAAMAAEFYSTGVSSWMIGAEIMKEDSGYEALRYMDVPSRDGGSIDSAEDYYDGLDVHYSSGVFNRLFYLISTQAGWDTRTAFDVMVKANMDYWTPYSTFNEGACGVLSAAEDLGHDPEELTPLMTMVGLKTDTCS